MDGAAALREALSALGRPTPSTRGGVLRGLLVQVCTQALHLLRGPAAVEGAARDALLESVRADLVFATICYFSGEPIRGALHGIRGLNDADRLGPSPELARASANAVVLAGFARRRRLAEAYGRRATGVASAVGEPAGLAWVYSMRAVHAVGVGAWEDAEAHAEAAAEQARIAEDRPQWITARAIEAVRLHGIGRFQDALDVNDDLVEAAQSTGNRIHLGWGLYSGAENLIRLGRLDEAEARLGPILGLLEEDALLRAARLRATGALAAIRLRQGRLVDAAAFALQVASMLEDSPPTIYSALDAYGSVAEVFLTVAEGGDRSGVEIAGFGVRTVERYARIFPIGRARAAWLRGRLLSVTGRSFRARRAFRRAAREAASRGQPWDEAVARAALGDADGARLLLTGMRATA